MCPIDAESFPGAPVNRTVSQRHRRLEDHLWRTNSERAFLHSSEEILQKILPVANAQLEKRAAFARGPAIWPQSQRANRCFLLDRARRKRFR